MMTEELPPLAAKVQLKASSPHDFTIPEDESSCHLQAVDSNDSPTPLRYGQKHVRNHHILENESRVFSGNANTHNLKQRDIFHDESDVNAVHARTSSKYRGLSDGEFPILYDYETTSQFPSNHRNIFSPSHSSQTTNVESKSSREHDNGRDRDLLNEKSNSVLTNGEIVCTSDDVIADHERTSGTRSRSLKQNRTESHKHQTLTRSYSDRISSGVILASSKGNSDANKIATLDQDFIQSPITRAIFLGEHALVLEYIKQGQNPSHICSISGSTFFHLVAQASTSDRELCWVPIIFVLSNAGADPNVKDKEGVTAAGIAISRKLVQIVAALLKCGAEVNGDDIFQAEQIRGVVKSEMLETIRRLSPSYWSAVHDLTPFKVNRLVKAWARVNVSRQSKTLIEYAKEHAKDNTIVKLLLQNEASIELAHAVMAGDRDRVKVLLCDSAVDLNTSDTSVKNNYFEPFAPLTLYGAALKLGHEEVLNELRTAQNRNKNYNSLSGISTSGSTTRGRGFGQAGTGISMKDTTVVFYKGKSNEDICEIRNSSKPVTSALCSIV